MVTWPRTGPTHLTIPGVVVCMAMITKSGNGSRKTLPEGNSGPPGGICWRPRCCASDADGGRARAATTMTVSNVPDRVMTQPLPMAGSCALRSRCFLERPACVTLPLGVIHAMGDDSTLPTRGLWLRPIGKWSECFQMTAWGSEAERLRISKCFPLYPRRQRKRAVPVFRATQGGF